MGFWNSSKQRHCQILWNHFASEMWHSLFMPPESQRGPQKKPDLLYFVFCNKCASAYASIRIGISLREYTYTRVQEKKEAKSKWTVHAGCRGWIRIKWRELYGWPASVRFVDIGCRGQMRASRRELHWWTAAVQGKYGAIFLSK